MLGANWFIEDGRAYRFSKAQGQVIRLPPGQESPRLKGMGSVKIAWKHQAFCG